MDLLIFILEQQYERTNWTEEQVRILTRTRFERCLRLYGHHLRTGVFS